MHAYLYFLFFIVTPIVGGLVETSNSASTFTSTLDETVNSLSGYTYSQDSTNEAADKILAHVENVKDLATDYTEELSDSSSSETVTSCSNSVPSDISASLLTQVKTYVAKIQSIDSEMSSISESCSSVTDVMDLTCTKDMMSAEKDLASVVSDDNLATLSTQAQEVMTKFKTCMTDCVADKV